MNLGIVKQPVQFMFTTFGVVVALVHVTMPVMVIMLAAGLSHIDSRLPEGRRKPGRRPRPNVPHHHPAIVDAGRRRRRHHRLRLDLQRLRRAAADRRWQRST